jgi:nucleoside-diphosphate-sugar epimerase
MQPLKFIVDVENNTATIPGTGNEIVGFTEVHDIGRAVAAACSLDAAWTRKTGWIVGDLITYNEVVKIAEEVKGASTTPT